MKILFKYANGTCTTDDKYRSTPLIYSGIYDHVGVVRVLLEGGADVRDTDAEGYTALHNAASHGNLNVCRLLLDRGAKVGSLNHLKQTPLHSAARKGHLSVVKLLVERGADVSIKCKSGKTARDLAGINGKKDVAEWLEPISHW